MATRHDEGLIERVLAEAASGARPLRDVLAAHGVPERTYHHWRRRYPAAPGDALRRLRELQRQIAGLRRANRRLERELALQREMLGKPWRRPLPGGRPSAGP